MRDGQRSVEAMENIGKLRARGWTLLDIAHSMGKTRGAVEKWAKGRSPPRALALDKLKMLLKMPSPSVQAFQDRGEARRLFAADLLVLGRRGWTARQIAKRLAVSAYTVYRYMGATITAPPEAKTRVGEMLDEPSPRTPVEGVLAAMSIASEEGVYSRGLDYLAEVAGYHPSRISQLISQLETKGLIVRLDSEPRKARRWRVNWQPVSIVGKGISRWEGAK